MPFGLASMTRAKSGEYSVRKAIPADARDEYKKLYDQGWEAKLTLPAGYEEAAKWRPYGLFVSQRVLVPFRMSRLEKAA
jgi:hypothetical protein